MHLIKPAAGQKLKWDIRLTLNDGRVVKIPGDRDRIAAQRLGMKIELLVRAKANGDGPPAELASWIANMPSSLAERLVTLGLLERRRVEQNVPILDHIEMYHAAVLARRPNTKDYVRALVARVRIVV